MQDILGDLWSLNSFNYKLGYFLKTLNAERSENSKYYKLFQKILLTLFEIVFTVKNPNSVVDIAVYRENLYTELLLTFFQLKKRHNASFINIRNVCSLWSKKNQLSGMQKIIFVVVMPGQAGLDIEGGGIGLGCIESSWQQ